MLAWTLLLLLIACTWYSDAATTMMPMMTTHPEASKFESFQFQFDGITGMLAVRSLNKCYIWQITSTEHQQIHTDDGLRNVEIRVLKEIENAYFTVVPKAILHPSIVGACSKIANHFYLVH
ncbi:uncharacterized protein LOC123523593 [Mercenaria mercenaria]|uniref:uncharacterized protein LOC123523593 n=1 Tax=Mercenaria mercenaria TaxID=6596 RepID=UPI00234EC242|nr:uncharacterized protein LOC123523593 [Mercenaria mercenaria]